MVTSNNAGQATAAQWALVQEMQAVLPHATVVLRVHRLAWKPEPQAPTLTIYGVLVTQKVGLFTLRREYAAPGVAAGESDRFESVAVIEHAVGA